MLNRTQSDPMRILLVGNYEPDGLKSMRCYTDWVERVLKSAGCQVTVIRAQPFFSRLARRRGLKKYLGYLDKFLLFPPRLRRAANQHDLVHVLDHSNSMYLRAVRGKPNLITCHDVLAIREARGDFPGSTMGWSGKLLQRWILSGLKGARHILCVSEKSASDLKSVTGETGADVRVVYNTLNWSYGPGAAIPADLAARLGISSRESYLLQVGGNGWYKNRTGVMRIFARLAELEEFSTAKLIMAGSAWTPAMRSVVREERLEGRVIEAVDVSNEELQALYCNALALLFPSLEEGFGWPIIEAQACGCPVIATGRPPMSEVAGEGGAILIDPGDTQGAADAIAAGLKQRETLCAAGFSNLKRFDEATIVEKYLAFYESILG